jgi:hypothetical protein
MSRNLMGASGLAGSRGFSTRDTGEQWKKPNSVSRKERVTGPIQRPVSNSELTRERNASACMWTEEPLGGVYVLVISGMPIRKPNWIPGTRRGYVSARPASPRARAQARQSSGVRGICRRDARAGLGSVGVFDTASRAPSLLGVPGAYAAPEIVVEARLLSIGSEYDAFRVVALRCGLVLPAPNPGAVAGIHVVLAPGPEAEDAHRGPAGCVGPKRLLRLGASRRRFRVIRRLGPLLAPGVSGVIGLALASLQGRSERRSSRRRRRLCLSRCGVGAAC